MPLDDKSLAVITERLINALRGIAACGTACPCCEMTQKIAERVLVKSGIPLIEGK